eukprot:69810_1
MRRSPHHKNSTYSEFPIKTKILFPIPYEIENFKYKNHKPYAYTILQKDLEVYHNLQRQIHIESIRRLSAQNKLKNKINNNISTYYTANQDALINAKLDIDNDDEDWNNDNKQAPPSYNSIDNNNNKQAPPSPNRMVNDSNRCDSAPNYIFKLEIKHKLNSTIK